MNQEELHEQFAIQVKSTGYKQKKWTLSKKNEDLKGSHIFYVFVSLNELDVSALLFYHIFATSANQNLLTQFI